jgi:hypothetical protein
MWKKFLKRICFLAEKGIMASSRIYTTLIISRAGCGIIFLWQKQIYFRLKS